MTGLSPLMKSSLIVVLLVFWHVLVFADDKKPEWCSNRSQAHAAGPCSNLPNWVLRVAQSARLSLHYELSYHLNPFFQSGDFNADHKLDVAVLVRHKTAGLIGIAIFLYGEPKPSVLGAGNSFGNGGKDFNWMDNWSVYSQGEAHESEWLDKTPTPKGVSLWVTKAESASAFIFWNGKQYVWRQESD
jgi:hypothetical protein